MGEFTPKLKISTYFRIAWKMCVLENSEGNYDFHWPEMFHFVIVSSIEETRLCIKVDL